MSYDGFGRINAKVFTDTTVPSNKVYVEKHDFNDDGSEKTLHLLLDDNGFKEETDDYAYDSAARIKSVVYNDGVSSQTLFSGTGSGSIYDVLAASTSATRPRLASWRYCGHGPAAPHRHDSDVG